MNTNFAPLLGIFGLEGSTFALLVVAVVFFCLCVVPVSGLVAIVYLIVRRVKTNPPPGVLAPVPTAAATTPASPLAAVPPASPVVASTVVLPRQCSQCSAVLPADVPEGLCPACLLQRGFATEGGAPPRPSAFEPPPISELAQLFPQLEILECLGRGGMGAVYKARQPRLDRFVALKILAPEKQMDPQFAERFEREARVLARLNHPHIVSVIDFGETQGRYYLLMEFVDGLTLRQILKSGKLSSEEALKLVPQICEALQYAHQQGIVHRDIKPENILLDKAGRLKIADFGIAKIAGTETQGPSLTGARDVMGTPHYMAPEQVETPLSVDHRADIYSLGVVFYEMLTGELPLGKFSPPSQRVQVDVRLDEVVLHALEKEPGRRYQQASQVKTDVETISGTPSQFAPAPLAAATVTSLANTAIITAPAVALMVAGLWKLFYAVLGVTALSGLSGWLGSFLGLGNLLGPWSAIAIFSVVLFKIVPGILILFGGFQMLQRRSYSWAIAAGILAIMACSLLGFPVGIWALVVLARDDVKSVFGVNGPAATPLAQPMQPGRWGRTVAWVVGGSVLVAIAVVALVVGLFHARLGFPTARAQSGTYPNAQPLPAAGLRQADGEFHKDSTQSFPLDANGRFSIDGQNGRIEIQGWSSNVLVLKTAIHGKSAASVEAAKVIIDSDPRHIAIHTDQSNGSGFWSWFQADRPTVDYVIKLPQGARLAGVNSVNGPIQIAGVTGSIEAGTVNGEMVIQNAAQNLKLSTVNGHIRADLAILGAGQSVSLDAVNGRIELGVPRDADANFSVSTVNGSISSEFPELRAANEFPLGNQLKGNLGNGDGRVKISTVNGIVKFLKNPAASPTPDHTNSIPVLEKPLEPATR